MICLPHFSLLQARLQTARLNQHIVIADLLHLMCRSHVQSGSPQLKDMLANATDNHLRHPPCIMVLLVIVQFASFQICTPSLEKYTYTADTSEGWGGAHDAGGLSMGTG